RRRGLDISPDRLVLTSSTSEAYSLLFRLLADPGDSVLAPAPAYPLFDLLARINDVALVSYPLSVDLDFAIDREALMRAAGPRTKAVIVVNPGNPSGAFLKRPEMESLVEICGPRGLPLISDEVFGDFAAGDAHDRVVTVAGDKRLLCFALNGLSKMLALPQLKLAWIAVSGSEPQVEEALSRLEVLTDTYLSVGTPVQLALPELLALRPAIQRSLQDRLDANRRRLERLAAASRGSRCLPAEGGWSAVLSVPRARGEEDLALTLLEEDGVLVHPGYFFDFPKEGHLVVSLLPPAEVFTPAIERLLARLDAES
ncbi:MAG TPA: pyridoxal phosphate-dependent aminotransferase, partial [Candidatus Polarisedimenticolia bacterium]|nr:pyridoxal phosphate-dependent aminotransferase [Candidatus Polarisedimenticolia bacterium]